MMRKLIISAAIGVVFLLTQTAGAQDRNSSRMNRRAPQGVRGSRPAGNPLVVQESVRRAQARRQRMQTRKRLGISAQRPTVPVMSSSTIYFDPYAAPPWFSYSPPVCWSALYWGF